VQYYLTDRIQTPIGDMILVACDGVLLLLEFEDATGRVAREMKLRFKDHELQETKNPFGLSQVMHDYFAGNTSAININMSRAVGTANGRNPIAIVVPCHRVIGADGSMTGYGGGIKRKEWLLRHEGALLV
jgi:methylated-DNA-[protein]-cysteine S-methyltransferase